MPLLLPAEHAAATLREPHRWRYGALPAIHTERLRP